ncbi:MAG: glutamine--fructose-6-phosphate aminotransferase, partial [Anaerolineae bacterium]|nr:glutamine--fructose-6-phosphate aminotransferase [Anaerolineae bacterium]
IVVMSARDPGKLVAARLGHAGGVIVGVGKDEMFVASDIPAILPHTQRVMHLESQELAVVKAQSVQFYNLDGSKVFKKLLKVPW